MTSSPPSLSGAGNNLYSPHSVFNPTLQRQEQHDSPTIVTPGNATTFPDKNKPSNGETVSTKTFLSSTNTSTMIGSGVAGGLVTLAPGRKNELSLNVSTGSFDPIAKSEAGGKNRSFNDSSDDFRSKEHQNKSNHNTLNGGAVGNGQRKEIPQKINHSFISDLLGS